MAPVKEGAQAPKRGLRRVFRGVMAVAMVIVGVLHFVAPAGFVKIVPAWLPWPLGLVYVSGVFEILGGVGIMVPKTRRAAGIGLVALYVAVFPANINMLVHAADFDIPLWALWARLPFQVVFIAWALWVSKDD